MTKSKIPIIGLLTFLAMLIMAIMFYKERTVILDASFLLFNILKDRGFAIQANRFVSFFTQSFILVGHKMGFSLSNIALFFSTSFVILPLLVFLYISYIRKNLKVSIAYLLFVTLITTHTFYWVQSELIQGIAFLFLFIVLFDDAIHQENIYPFFLLSSNVLLIIVCFAHPLIIIPFCFFILFYVLKFPHKRKLIGSIALSFFALYCFKILFFKSNYDSLAMDLAINIKTLFPNYINLQSNKNCIQYFIHNYYFIPLLLSAVCLFYLRHKKYALLVLMLLFFIGFFFLINLSYPNGADQFYLESHYLIFAIIVGFPFAYDVLPSIHSNKTPMLIVLIICVACVIRIYNTHFIYTNRLNWNRNLITKVEKMPNKKVILPVGYAPKDTMIMTWGSSYELWLLSTIELGRSSSIIINENENEFDWAVPSKQSFISKWGVFDYTALNRRYFIFNDTTAYNLQK
jgi:hypothetical protein